jgi:Relaxase/Mobilisation nuclease domain
LVPSINKGTGVTGALRYVLGEGNDPITGKPISPISLDLLRELAGNINDPKFSQKSLIYPDGTKSRAEVLGGQNCGFDIETMKDVEIARRQMEFIAMPENQAGRTRKCEKDCLHISLAWHQRYKPSREEQLEAAREALKAIGMEDAMAVFVSHADKGYWHLHIVASRINPKTGLTFKDRMDKTILQTFGIKHVMSPPQ